MHLSEAKHVLQSFGFLVLLRLLLEAIPATEGCHYPVQPLTTSLSLPVVLPAGGHPEANTKGPPDPPVRRGAGSPTAYSTNDFKATRRWGGGGRITTHRVCLRGSRKYFWANSSIVLGGSATASSPLSAERALTGGPCRISAIAKVHRHPHPDPAVKADLPATHLDPQLVCTGLPNQAPPSRPVSCMGLAAVNS